jgi:hypothetical protein
MPEREPFESVESDDLREPIEGVAAPFFLSVSVLSGKGFVSLVMYRLR